MADLSCLTVSVRDISRILTFSSETFPTLFLLLFSGGPPMKPGIKTLLLRLFLKALLTAAGAAFLFFFVFHIVLYEDDRLEPWLCPGDLSGFLQFTDGLRTGDIVEFSLDGEISVGRIVRTSDLPGEEDKDALSPGTREESVWLVLLDEKEEAVSPVSSDKIRGKLVLLLRRRGF